MRKLIAGNWKMNGLKASLGEIDRLHARLASAPAHCDIAICPPATLVATLADKVAAGPVRAGAQDCHTGVSGAHTGDISAQMLADAGAAYVIVGHSERRADHGETDGLVRLKAEAALAAGLTPIICVGETEAERMNGVALTVVEQQLTGSMPVLADGQSVVIAYEPVWAIGTGLTPTTADIAEMHAHIRGFLQARLGAAGDVTPILYGGSMKPDNAAAILAVANVDGGLIGGASLKADDFHAIIAAA